MLLPSYYLPRPHLSLDAELEAAFETLYTNQILDSAGRTISYDLAAPKWQFLCWLADTKGLLLHGSGSGEIAKFEPRQSNDVSEFGNRCAVYAASDGLWPMYFAIVDRTSHKISLVNGCFRVVEEGKAPDGPFYFFSINQDALDQSPWRQGFVYIMRQENFESQPPTMHGGAEIHVAEWASLAPVTPLAKLAVNGGDFPFLNEIRGHDLEVVQRRANANPDGFPWLDEGEDS